MEKIISGYLGDYICTNPKDENLAFGGDLSGHVDMIRDDEGDCHDNYGYGNRRRRILELEGAYDLVLANTYFRRRDTYVISFASGNTIESRLLGTASY